MTQIFERIVKLETTLEDSNKTIHRVEEAIFGNGKPGLLSDFRLLAESVNRHHRDADERIAAENAEKHRRKLDWQWVITTIVAVSAIVAALMK